MVWGEVSWVTSGIWSVLLPIEGDRTLPYDHPRRVDVASMVMVLALGAVLLCFSMMLLCLTLFSCAALLLLKSEHLKTDTNAHLFAFFLKNSLSNAVVLFAIKSRLMPLKL